MANARNNDKKPTRSPAVVRSYIGVWQPKRPLSSDATAFVRRTAKKCRPQAISEAKSLMDSMADLVVFLVEQGVSVRAGSDVPRIFDDTKLSAWEHDLRRRRDAGTMTQGTFNSRMSRLKVSLLRLGDDVEHGAFMMQHGRTRRGPLTAPMPDDAFARWLQVADAQPEETRLRLYVLLLSCRGAGLGSEDFRMLRGSDIVRRADGTTVITVHGRRARTAVVLDRFAEALSRAAAHFGDDLVVGTWAHRVNPTSDLVDAIKGGHGLPRPMPRALRRAYVIELLSTDISALVLQRQLGGESLSEIEGAIPFIDPSHLDTSYLRCGAPPNPVKADDVPA